MPASPNPVNVVMSKAIKSGQASASQRMVIRFADRQRAIFYRAEYFAPSCRLDSVEHRIGEHAKSTAPLSYCPPWPVQQVRPDERA
jgi:hypothetical protein